MYKSESIDDIAAKYVDSEKNFPLKRVLWIGSESYVAPAITVIQGLDMLGFEIYTPNKPNINSWFCNNIIDNETVKRMSFDFVLSATHWGTDYTAYKQLNLDRFPKVLIDGDDATAGDTWQSRHARYVEEYEPLPQRKLRKKIKRFGWRWMSPLGDYSPDVLFTMQKQLRGEGIYIPSGIHLGYFEMGQQSASREYDFCHIPGPGSWRKAMNDLIRAGALPQNSKVWNEQVRGKAVYYDEIKTDIIADRDPNIHSYHRWVRWGGFYKVLNDSKVLIHPGIDHYTFWDCKRPYEGWACGCLMLMRAPSTQVEEYPPTDIWPEAVFQSDDDFMGKALYYFTYPDELEEARESSHQRAIEFMSPKPIARYFLGKIYELIS